MHIETKCLHEGYKPGNGEPKALPIYQSTTYTYDSTEHIGQLFDLHHEHVLVVRTIKDADPARGRK